jgi:hypothetical protein
MLGLKDMMAVPITHWPAFSFWRTLFGSVTNMGILLTIGLPDPSKTSRGSVEGSGMGNSEQGFLAHSGLPVKIEATEEATP